MTTGLIIEPGRSEDALVAARLIADTDRSLFELFGAGDPTLWQEVSEREWRGESGIYCHDMSYVARLGQEVVGLVIGYATPSTPDLHKALTTLTQVLDLTHR